VLPRIVISILAVLVCAAAVPEPDEALTRAERLLAKKDYKGAEEALRKIVAASPSDARVHGDLALALLAQKKTREAVDEGRLAAAFGPEAPEARYIYGLTLKAAGRPREAARELEKAVALKPDALPPLRVAAETYLRVIAREPGVATDRAALAEFYWQSGQTASGNKTMDEALAKFPDDPDLPARYGRALIEQERFLDGAEKLESARKKGAQGVALLLLLGDAYRQGGRADASLEVFTAAAHANPASGDARAELGRALSRAGAYDRALPELEAAVQLAPKSSDVLLDYGRALESLGRLDEAEAAYRSAVKLSPNLPRGHYALGRLLLRQGRKAEGDAELARHRSLYEQGLKKVSELESKRAELALGWSELHEGKAEAALSRFTALPESVDTLLGRAEALSRLERHAEALRVLERARTLAPEDERVQRRLAAERLRAEESL
jgi:protein O-GlcNAc transferase